MESFRGLFALLEIYRRKIICFWDGSRPISHLKKFVDFVWLILNLLRKKGCWPSESRSTLSCCLSIIYELFWRGFGRRSEGVKVIHTAKNLFCNVALICNLVQEFNGLVSKGLAI